MDIDTPGRAAAKKIANYVAQTAKEVRIIHLPLDVAKYPKGDINDWVGGERATAGDLLRVMESAPEHRAFVKRDRTDRGTRSVTLGEVPAAENIGWQLEFTCVVSALDTTPYLVPKGVGVECERDQPLCHLCPVKQKDAGDDGCVELEVNSSCAEILDMIGSSKKNQREMLREALNIPVCSSVEFTPRSHYTAVDVRLSPQLEIGGGGSTSGAQLPALCVGSDVELNVPYLMHGRVFPHPRTQQATVVVDRIEEAVDSLQTFQPTPAELDELKLFQPKAWNIESLREKLDELYDDLESNVTRIYGRRRMHLILDMTYHSPLSFKLGPKRVNGWVNSLILGDSAQGKSECVERLMEHYELGERVPCKNATIAGLLGGLQQMGTRWYVSWGVIPTHDRRLVVLEEVKGASTEVIGRLTDMRSSGIAEIPKIERRRAHARTRLVFISNARSNRSISSYSFGVEAVHELVGALEDVRRFDIAIILTAGHVGRARMVSSDAAHVHTAELCRRLILWAWTLSEEQVTFEGTLVDSANMLCSKYSEDLPLIDRGTAAHKIARLAAALAARTFSFEKDQLIVRQCHIDFVTQLIDREYSGAHFGYEDFSHAQDALNRMTDEKGVRRYLISTRYPRDLVSGLLYRDEIALLDIQDWCGVDREAGQQILSTFVRHHALRRNQRFSYSKTPPFIQLLKRMSTETILENAEPEEF